jgi:hypothetical protein
MKGRSRDCKLETFLILFKFACGPLVVRGPQVEKRWNREKRDEAWDLLLQYTREKIPDVDLCSVKKKWTVSWHHLGKNCTEFGIVVLSPLLQPASMNSVWILKDTSKVPSPLMRVW